MIYDVSWVQDLKKVDENTFTQVLIIKLERRLSGTSSDSYHGDMKHLMIFVENWMSICKLLKLLAPIKAKMAYLKVQPPEKVVKPKPTIDDVYQISTEGLDGDKLKHVQKINKKTMKFVKLAFQKNGKDFTGSGKKMMEDK